MYHDLDCTAMSSKKQILWIESKMEVEPHPVSLSVVKSEGIESEDLASEAPKSVGAQDIDPEKDQNKGHQDTYIPIPLQNQNDDKQECCKGHCCNPCCVNCFGGIISCFSQSSNFCVNFFGRIKSCISQSCNCCSNFFGTIKSCFSQSYGRHKGCLDKTKDVSTKFLPGAFDTGTDVWAAYNHYM